MSNRNNQIQMSYRHLQNLFLYYYHMQFLPCPYLSNHDSLLGRPPPPPAETATGGVL